MRSPQIRIFRDITFSISDNKRILKINPKSSYLLAPDDALHVADKVFLQKRVNEILQLIRNKKNPNKVVELTSDFSHLRIGGGFLQIENDDIFLVRRDENAKRAPLMFDISAGVFDELWSNPFEMMLAEAAEILRVLNGNLIVPRAINNPSIVDFKKILQEYITSYKTIFSEEPNSIIYVDTNVFPASDAVKVYYGNRYIGEFLITFEVDTSSLELIGFLKYNIEDTIREKIHYGDGELLFISNNEKRPLHREIHKINSITLLDSVWKNFRLVAKKSFLDIVSKSMSNVYKKVFTGKLIVALDVLSEYYSAYKDVLLTISK